MVHGILLILKSRRRLFYLLLFLSLFVQLILIGYRYFNGYESFVRIDAFFLRLFFRTSVGFLISSFVAFLFLSVISSLNKIAAWDNHWRKRVIFQFFICAVMSVCASLLTSLFVVETFINHAFNVFHYFVGNVTIMSVLEAMTYYNESKQAKEIAEDLQKELSQIKFEVLKSQINPHFLFNSLNVLSGLIDKDTTKAQQFIN